MRFDNYTPKVFFENFKKDSEVFGEETAQAIYEEIFSALCGKHIKLDSFTEMINEGVITEELITETSAEEYMEMAKAANAALLKRGAINPLMKSPEKYMEIAKTANATALNSGVVSPLYVGGGLLGKLSRFLAKLPGKAREFFGNLKGNSFSEIMNKGMGWLSANPVIALKTAGGVALLALLIRALKKRGQLAKYKQLQAIYDRGNSLREDCYDVSLEDTKEKEAMRKVLEECKTNKALSKVILG